MGILYISCVLKAVYTVRKVSSQLYSATAKNTSPKPTEHDRCRVSNTNPQRAHFALTDAQRNERISKISNAQIW